MTFPLDRYVQLQKAGALLDHVKGPVLVWTEAPVETVGTTKEFTKPSLAATKSSSDPKRGETYVFELVGASADPAGPLVIGRSSKCHLRLNDDTVSRLHAEITSTRHGWTVKDLGTKNGTWVDRLKVTLNEPATLAEGARIQLGNVELFFMSPESLSAYIVQRGAK